MFKFQVRISILLLILIFVRISCYSQKGGYEILREKYEYFRNQNKLDSALIFAKQMNSWALINEGDSSLRYAVSYRYIGNCYDSSETSLFYFNESLKFLQKQNRTIHSDYAKALNNIANIYRKSGDHVNAEKFYQDAIIIFEKLINKNQFDLFYLASSLSLSKLYYFQTEEFNKVEETMPKAIKNSFRFIDTMSFELADCYDFLANFYRRLNVFDKAFYYFGKVIEIDNFLKMSKTPAHAKTLSNIGLLYQDIQDNANAQKYILEALKIFSDVYGENDINVAENLRMLGHLKTEEGDFKEAQNYLESSNKIILELYGNKDKEYAKNLVVMGIFFSTIGDLKKGNTLYQEALRIDNIPMSLKAVIYNNLGANNVDGSLYQDALSNFLNSLSISMDLFSEENLDIAWIYHNLGRLYYLTADYKKSIEFYTKSYDLRRKLLKINNPEIAFSLNGLSHCYRNLGNFEKAKKYAFEALQILNKSETSNEVNAEIAGTLSNLSRIYSLEEDYKSALNYAKDALKLNIKIFGLNYSSTAISLNALGLIYFQMNQLDSAEYYQKKSIEVCDQPYFKTNLGMLYNQKGNFKEAQNLLNQVLSFDLNNLNANHPHIGDTYFRIGRINLNLGEYSTAEINLKKSVEIKTSDVVMNFSFLSNEEKKSFWNDNLYYFNYINNWSVHFINAYRKFGDLCFNINLISKSLLLETTRELDQAISVSSDQLLKLQYNELKEFRRLVSKMQSEGSDKKEIINRYSQQADSLDKILVNKLGEYANAKRKFEITWKDVQAGLSTKEAAIEFARYYDYQDGAYKYMALIVRPGYEYPKLVKLGSELNIKNASSQREFSDLYKFVWVGIDSLLTGVKTIYYSPVGELNNVSFSALMSETNNQSDSTKSSWSYLMDRYDLHQVTTTRYIADGTLKRNDSLPLSIKLIGGVNYSDLPLTTDSVSINETTEDLALQISLQNEVIDAKSNRGGKISYLKGSEIEVKEINNTLKNKGWLTTISSGKNANEHLFKKELNLKSPGIIHISTHGFAFPEKVIKEEFELQMNETTTYRISEDPMVRCGLMLSGANITWNGDSKKMIETTGDDGILTAAEVANLDLSNTKLVVLSACETGLGKIESTEGTFGLKRGFKLAGVDQIIVSLWKVPDNESMELMTLFYSELAKSNNIDSSFSNAQKVMRNRYPFEPQKWAGFVLVR
jgi:tetratricopeptide (TPR) repeat protein/CHAT domain-containing protein